MTLKKALMASAAVALSMEAVPEFLSNHEAELSGLLLIVITILVIYSVRKTSK
jgi:hypothetical protein